MIATKLGHSDVATQSTFVDAFEGAQEIADIGPQSFGRVDMDFANPVTIIIARPFVLGVTDGRMRSNDMVVAEPFIGVAPCLWSRKTVHVRFQHFLRRMMHHPQSHLPAFTTHRPDNRRAIIIKGAVPALLVGSTARRILGVGVFLAFFPPHSETSHQFQFVDQVAAPLVGPLRH